MTFSVVWREEEEEEEEKRSLGPLVMKGRGGRKRPENKKKKFEWKELIFFFGMDM